MDKTITQKDADDAKDDTTEAVLSEDAPLAVVKPQKAGLESVAGLADAKETLEVAVINPILKPELSARTHGVLVHGPTGVGKTHLARALVGELAAQDFTVVTLEGALGPGETTEAMIDIAETLEALAPSVFLLDPLPNAVSSAVGPALKEMVARLNATNEQVLVVGTARTDDVRNEMFGSFDGCEVMVSVESPDRARRQGLLQQIFVELCGTAAPRLDVASVRFDAAAERTEGFSVRQLRAVCERAIQLTLVTDAETAVTDVELARAVGSVRSEFDIDESDDERSAYEVEVPSVTYDDIGGLTEAKDLFEEALKFPARYADVFDEYDLSAARGVLLYGPPGNGKTMLAKAVATESERTFLAVSGPELKAPYVGQTEAQIRRVFETAREKAPSVVFFDEFDALAPDRGTVGTATYKVDHVNTLLAELDGLTEDMDILVIAATNRPEAIDPAILRPGRLGEYIEVPIPEGDARAAVVAATVADYPLADDVTPAWVAEQLPCGVSAATIASVCEETLRTALREVHEASVDDPEDALVVTRTNVRRAIATMEDEVRKQSDNDLRGFV